MTTLFTFGYFGWGNATERLVEAVDAVEESRGFEPPVFVDIRIRRGVRAEGFKEAAFEKLLGSNRHHWMQSLGNKFIKTRTGASIQIAEPKAAEDLLDLALTAAGHKQRLLFFCGCQWPRCNRKIACHRTTVAGLVLKAAKKRGEPVETVEWPGGKPSRINLDIEAKLFSSIGKGRKTIPLGRQGDLAAVAGLPWGSVAMLHSDDGQLRRVVGRAIWQKGQWCLPVLGDDEKDAGKLRRDLGLEPASV